MPPLPMPTRINCAAGEPFCWLAETAEGWENCVRRGVAPLYRSQVRVWSEAPLARPVTWVWGIGPPAGGSTSLPLLSKVIDPVTGAIGLVTSASGKVIE